MSRLILFNKPYGVLCQFRRTDERSTLADFFSDPAIHPCGRLDFDSEGLLLLTNDGQLNARITEPKYKLPKTYWAQVDGEITDEAIKQLKQGIMLNDGMTMPAIVKKIAEPAIWQRDPPIRYRANIPTSWIELTITEGRNRQVRRMTAAVGFPTLRLIRAQIGEWQINDLALGMSKEINVSLGRIKQVNH
ncbi:MAG TPA: pseudouridine synthase, partial [Agitococcus sp.]|nr:pseudouridine synthase [Agitococcus sp.]HNN28635.1 pseudouridine synthase [Agitococcus sp.]